MKLLGHLFQNMNLKSILFIYFSIMTRIFSISADCPTLINFLKSLNLHSTDPYLYQIIPADCCNNQLGDPQMGTITIGCVDIGSNQYITTLYIQNVKINGEIKSQFIPSTLSTLVISNTPLNCSIPVDLPDHLQVLHLTNNKLQGSIPNTMPSRLVDLQLSRNQLNILPDLFPNSITTLYLDHNQFTKMPPIPQNIQYLDISNNFIFDNLPELSSFHLKLFNAINNLIFGAIPILPALMTSLNLQHNQLNGSFPNLPNSIIELKLSFNRLSGNLSNSWPLDIAIVDLSHNLLSGSISNFTDPGRSIFGYTPYLDFSWNLLSGNLPFLGNKDYDSLVFSHNQLSGSIDLGLSSTRILDLSFNQFDILPNNLPRFLESLYLKNNRFSSNMTFEIPNSLVAFDISCNDLTGELPNWQGPYFAHFNFSYNSFTGRIPKSLLARQSVDVSNNQLSGCIDETITGSILYLNDNLLSGNLTLFGPIALYVQNNFIQDVVMQSDRSLVMCDMSSNPMAPGVFGKTFKSICKLDFVYASNRSTCEIVPFTVNYTRRIPDKPMTMSISKLETTLAKSDSITFVPQITTSFSQITRYPIRSISQDNTQVITTQFTLKEELESSTFVSNDQTSSESNTSEWSMPIFKVDWSPLITLRLCFNAMLGGIIAAKTPIRKKKEKKMDSELLE
eukprot:NODE_400_length_8090_cov_0.771522.p1 type:complete len:676 gc:universal NODE_400_length_8090_cov_0.771522:1226-3253(+)